MDLKITFSCTCQAMIDENPQQYGNFTHGDGYLYFNKIKIGFIHPKRSTFYIVTDQHPDLSWLNHYMNGNWITYGESQSIVSWWT